MSAAIAEAAKALPEQHPKLLHARVVLALTHRYVGEPARLESELDALLPVLRQSTDADPADLPGALESAVVLALNQGRNDDSERFAREGIEVALRRFASDDPVVLTAQWTLVRSLHQQRKSDEAYALATEVMPKTLAAYNGDVRNPHVIEARDCTAECSHEPDESRKASTYLPRRCRARASCSARRASPSASSRRTSPDSAYSCVNCRLRGRTSKSRCELARRLPVGSRCRTR